MTNSNQIVPVAIHNSWNNLLTEQTAEKGVQKITATIEKGAQRVVDAVGKIKATNNEVAASQSYTSESNPLGMIYGKVEDSLQKVSDFVDTHPDIAPKKVQDFNKQLVSIIESIDAIGEADERLDYAQSTLDWELKAVSREQDNWRGGCDQSVSVANSFGRVVGGFSELLNQG